MIYLSSFFDSINVIRAVMLHTFDIFVNINFPFFDVPVLVVLIGLGIVSFLLRIFGLLIGGTHPGYTNIDNNNNQIVRDRRKKLK